jgi:hypothetical protein
MSTVAEIEAAITRLPVKDAEELREWLEQWIEDQIEMTPEFEASIERGNADLIVGRSCMCARNLMPGAATQIFSAEFDAALAPLPRNVATIVIAKNGLSARQKELVRKGGEIHSLSAFAEKILSGFSGSPVALVPPRLPLRAPSGLPMTAGPLNGLRGSAAVENLCMHWSLQKKARSLISDRRAQSPLPPRRY